MEYFPVILGIMTLGDFFHWKVSAAIFHFYC